MFREMMKSKIHRATVTESDINYMGSISIDSELMRLADIKPMEKVSIVNLNTGGRFDTYVIEATAGSGTIGLNGGAARLGVKGDVLIIISYAFLDEKEEYLGRVVFVDAENNPIEVATITSDSLMI